MAIDVNTEPLLSFAEAATRLSTGRRRLHVATIHRWATRGVRGVRLEYVKVGRSCVTTADAIARFVADQTDCDRARHHVDHTTAPDRPRHRTSRSRRIAIDRAKRELAEAGIQ